LGGQHLLAEIVDDMPIRTAEPGDELRPIRPIGQPHGGQLQPRRPTLGAVHQRVHIGVGQVEAESNVEQLGCLRDGEM